MYPLQTISQRHALEQERRLPSEQEECLILKRAQRLALERNKCRGLGHGQ